LIEYYEPVKNMIEIHILVVGYSKNEKKKSQFKREREKKNV